MEIRIEVPKAIEKRTTSYATLAYIPKGIKVSIQ
jgi:hypothetical protein